MLATVALDDYGSCLNSGNRALARRKPLPGSSPTKKIAVYAIGKAVSAAKDGRAKPIVVLATE